MDMLSTLATTGPGMIFLDFLCGSTQAKDPLKIFRVILCFCFTIDPAIIPTSIPGHAAVIQSKCCCFDKLVPGSFSLDKYPFQPQAKRKVPDASLLLLFFWDISSLKFNHRLCSLKVTREKRRLKALGVNAAQCCHYPKTW